MHKKESAVRFILGDEQKKSITLTTQDLSVKSAFNQSHKKIIEWIWFMESRFCTNRNI